jgi:hypothetical protein
MEPFAPRDNSHLSPVEPARNSPEKVSKLSAELLASQPDDHWRSGDEFLVEQYAQSILAGREAFEHLQSEGYVLESGKANSWIIIWEKSTRASVQLAARLRLSPQQRHDAKAAARELHRNQFGNPITSVRGWGRRRIALDDDV